MNITETLSGSEVFQAVRGPCVLSTQECLSFEAVSASSCGFMQSPPLSFLTLGCTSFSSVMQGSLVVYTLKDQGLGQLEPLSNTGPGNCFQA